MQNIGLKKIIFTLKNLRNNRQDNE